MSATHESEIIAALQQGAGRVLVVEQDATVRRDVSALLRRDGSLVECVATASAARKRLRERAYSVVVCDAKLVRPDQPNLIEAGRSTRGATMFILTRDPRDPALVFGHIGENEADVAGVVDKPLHESELLDLVRRAVAVAARRAVRLSGSAREEIEGDVLLVEDDPAAAALVEEQLVRLGATGRIKHVGRLADALSEPGLGDFALALVDLHLPDARGLDAVRRLAMEAPTLPLVVLSGTCPDLAEQALLVGAQEVVQKGAPDDEVRDVLRRANLRKQADRHVRYLATHDAMTGLYNAVHFRDRIGQCLTRVLREKTACAVMYLDLDGFKPINDEFGHAAGDQVLRAVASRLKEVIRSCDAAARLGGDEFALLLEDVYERKSVRHVAQRVLRAVAAPVRLDDGSSVRVTASIGVALCPQAAATAESLLHRADAAMLDAKRAGRSQYCFAAEEGSAPAPRSRLMSELREAVHHGGFYVVYQPQLDLRTRDIRGLEALLRWRRPEGRAVGPDEFVPLLEQLDLIGTVGAFVLREACRHAQSWATRRGRSVSIAVNVSPLQMEDSEFVPLVESILSQYGISPSQLELEVTEGTLMREGTAVRSTLRRLRELGVRIALDDFGTGYAALSYLREFPLDVIKIDRSFVEHVLTHERSRILVGAIIDLGRQLGMKVLAEGVESPHQLAYLRDRGCDGCQGYLFGKPHFTGQLSEFLH